MFCCFPQLLTLLVTASKDTELDTGLLYPQQVKDAEKQPSFFQPLFYRKTSNPTGSRIPVQLHKKHYQGILLTILQISCVRAQKNCRKGSKIVTAVDKKKEKRQNLSCLFPLDFLSYFLETWKSVTASRGLSREEIESIANSLWGLVLFW